MGINFGTTAFVTQEVRNPTMKGRYSCVRYFETDDYGVPFEFPPKNERLGTASANDFNMIPGSPIAYWVSDRFLSIFSENPTLGEKTKARQGLATGDNNTFARLWFEVSFSSFYVNASSCADTKSLSQKWYPYNKGGDFRRWYGNIEWVVNWYKDGQEIRNFRDGDGKLRSRPQNTDCYFQSGLTWSDVTSGHLSVRSLPGGAIYDISGHSAFPAQGKERKSILAFLNTKFAKEVAQMLNPTLHFQIGDYQTFPYPTSFIRDDVAKISDRCVEISQADWDGQETSWDFSSLPLLVSEHRAETLKNTYARLRAHWRDMTEEMQRLEEENNRIFIDAYGLQDELTPKVPLEEITLTCNPAYRYGGQKAEAELEALLLTDTMRELVSYAVGCMFGRYSLDAPGLMLANQGEAMQDYLAKVTNPSFAPDPDNVIPVLDGDWFADDIAARFRRFLRITFGEEHFQENLAFVEEAFGKDIRRYFTRDFFNDHVKRYKKRPIYWLFSSPKGTFNALIYMHRFRSDTVSVVLNDYLREFRSKLEAYRRAQAALSISGDASPAQKTKALKEIEATARQIEEIDAWERDVLFPLATQKMEIDLDDGVKANYPKLGAALKPIKGLNDSDD